MDELKISRLFVNTIYPLREDEYLDEEGLPRCNSGHTLRVYVSDDKCHFAGGGVLPCFDGQ